MNNYKSHPIHLKISGLLSFFVLLVTTSFSQTPTLEWAYSYGSAISDNATAIASDASGNVYVAGQFGGTIDFDPGPGIFTMSSTTGGPDAYLSKFDVNGNFLWARQISGPGAGIFSLAVDNAGNVYVSGAGDGYVFIAKVDPNNYSLWTDLFENTDRVMIAVDAGGNVYATGSFYNTVDLDPGTGIFNLTATEASFVLKLDTYGQFVWGFQIENIAPSSNPGRSILVGRSGDVYVSGPLDQPADFDPSPSVYTLPTDGSDIFIAKYDANGNLIWAKTVSGNGTIYNYSMAKDASENIFLTGSFFGTIDFDPGSGVFNLSTGGSQGNTYVLKLDLNGNFIWAKSIAAPGENWAYSIACDNFGNVYTTGFFGGITDFDPGPGTFSLNTTGGSSYDIFIWKLDNSGNLVTALPLGSANYDLGMAIAIDPFNKILCGGEFGGTMDCDPTTGNYDLNMLDFGDAFFLKFSQCKNITYDTINKNSCSSYLLNGQTYSSTGTYRQVLQNAQGCDSIITINLVVSSSNDTSKVTVCEHYDWNGLRYTASGFYRDTLKNVLGCDSIINLDLTVHPTISYVATIIICEGENYEGYTSSGNYIDSFKSVYGCDSIRFVALTVKPASRSNFNATICEGENYFGHFTSGIFHDTLVAANGCDSIRTLGLVVHPRAVTNFNVTICEGQSYFAGGADQTLTGIYKDTLKTSFGCDSVIITNLKVNAGPKPDLGPDRDLCKGESLTLNPGSFSNYKWQDQSSAPNFTVTNVGTYWVQVTDNNNCGGADSLVVKNIVPLPTNFLKEADTLCKGNELMIQSLNQYQNYSWSTGATQPSIKVTHEGTYALEVTDSHNCKGSDSIQIIEKVCQNGVYIPTAFSPNGDRLNDVFKATVIGRVELFQLDVYNRWGNVVFHTTDPNKGWDGKLQGIDLATDVFVWLCSYRLQGKQKVMQKGVVTLVR